MDKVEGSTEEGKEQPRQQVQPVPRQRWDLCPDAPLLGGKMDKQVWALARDYLGLKDRVC